MINFKLPPLPGILARQATAISSILPSTGAEYDAINWRSRFGENDSDLEDIIQRFPKVITRANVGSLQNTNYREVFLATQIWGFARAGYGAYRTERILAQPGAMHTIEDVCKFASASDIPSAYSAAVSADGRNTKLNGWGPPFFTKPIYMCGRACRLKPLPIVFDTKLANALETISLTEPWKVEDFGKFSRKETGKISWVRPDVDGYMRLVLTFDSWAAKLGCPADNLEFYIWKMGGVGQLQNGGSKRCS